MKQMTTLTHNKRAHELVLLIFGAMMLAANASAKTSKGTRLKPAVTNTLIRDQFCQVYYKGDNIDDCKTLKANVRSEMRGKGKSRANGTPTLELGDPKKQPPMVFLHGWPDTAALWANQFEYFCGPGKDYFCVAPSFIDYHPDIPPANDDQLSLHVQRKALYDVITDPELGLNMQDITFVIFDFGAIFGYQMIYEYPDLFQRVIAIDIGLDDEAGCFSPTANLEKYLPEYQQNNIESFRNKNNVLMEENTWWSPCADCNIAPGSNGVGYLTGWPYFQFVRTDVDWTTKLEFRNSDDLIDCEEWEFDITPSLPKNKPILYLYTDPSFTTDSWISWLTRQGELDGKTKAVQVSDSGETHESIHEHWVMLRQSKETNRQMEKWLKEFRFDHSSGDAQKVEI